MRNIGGRITRFDVDIARRALSPSIQMSGVVYDVATGLIEVVVPPGA